MTWDGNSENNPGKDCLQFGFAAVDMDFITEAQMHHALQIQGSEKISGGRHRLLPTILFDQDWMTSPQIETVLKAVQDKSHLEK